MKLALPSLLPTLLLGVGLLAACADGATEVGGSSGNSSVPPAPAEIFDLNVSHK